MTTRYLNDFRYQPFTMDVLAGGTLTTVQDYPGRTGYWPVGVPPSGPFDNLSFRLGNRLLGNAENAAGLEFTLNGPTLKFNQVTRIALTGGGHASHTGMVSPGCLLLRHRDTARADPQAGQGQRRRGPRLSGRGWRPAVHALSGLTQHLHSGAVWRAWWPRPAHRRCSAFSGSPRRHRHQATVPDSLKPALGNHWTLRVIYGPHGAPDFFYRRRHGHVLLHRLAGALQLQPHRDSPGRPEAQLGSQ